MYRNLADGHGLPHDPLKAIMAPRPIGWISTKSRSGAVNLAPYSFFNMLGDTPPLIGFSSQGRKDSMTFAEEGGDFVFNFVGLPDGQVMNESSAPLPRGTSEFEALGVEVAASEQVRSPRVASAPAALECQWVETVPLRGANGESAGYYLVIGEVVGFHIDDRYLVDGLVDTAAMQPLMRGGYRDFFTVSGPSLVMQRPVGGWRREPENMQGER